LTGEPTVKIQFVKVTIEEYDELGGRRAVEKFAARVLGDAPRDENGNEMRLQICDLREDCGLVLCQYRPEKRGPYANN